MGNIQIIALLALGWCIVFCLIHFFRLVKRGKVKDLSQKSGNVTSAVVYSNTAAMLPNQKESAYKHIPTFTAGAIYHVGTFLSLLLFVLMLFDPLGKIWSWLMGNGWWVLACAACFLLVSSLCGLSLLLKRVFSKKLRPFSNIDDYVSNGLVTLFQLFGFALFTIFAICAIFNFRGETYRILSYPFLCSYRYDIIFCGYFISAALLFFYLPFGKLKHVIYYFAARYHLGFFYGIRGTWPPKKTA
jgi:nitrate reductase gamma subunit